MASIQLSHVDYVYEGAAGFTHAISNLELFVAAGESVSVIGPSGCGKSTTLLLAAGLLRPSSGVVRVGGERVEGPRLGTALILQDFGLLPWKRTFDNAALGLRIRRTRRQRARQITEAALAQVGLTGFERAYPGELSGGMRQRLALVRALALDADVMLMDEPLSALDALTREQLQDLLLALWKERGHTQVIVTHSIEEAVFLGQWIVVLSVRPGTVASIVGNPGMGSVDYRASAMYHARASQLRRILRAMERTAGEGEAGTR